MMVEAACTWKKVCAGTWPKGSSSFWLGLLWECKEIHGGCYGILMGHQRISPGAIPGCTILTSFLKICLSLNLKDTLCGSWWQWGVTVCVTHMAGGSKGSFNPFQPSLYPGLLQALRQSSNFCEINIAQRPGPVLCWWQCCSRSLKCMCFGSMAPSPEGGPFDSWGQQWL